MVAELLARELATSMDVYSAAELQQPKAI